MFFPFGVDVDEASSDSARETPSHHVEDDEKVFCGIDTRMKTFNEYVWFRMPVEHLVLEISELFPKRGMQEIFDREVQKLREKTNDPVALDHLDEFQRIDVLGYIDSSLRRAQFHQNELDPLVHDLCVKLLMGGFFRGWTGQSLVARFKVSVSNAIKSLRSRAATRRSRQQELSFDAPAKQQQSDTEIIDEFRSFVATRFGDHVVRVLDHRLEGEADTKALVGARGLETSYKVKKAVADLKQAIRVWAGNDPELTQRIKRLVAEEKRTLDRRFGKLAGVSGQG
jgi:hypothetical protein